MAASCLQEARQAEREGRQRASPREPTNGTQREVPRSGREEEQSSRCRLQL